MEEEGLVEACRAAMKALEGAREETGKAVAERGVEVTGKAEVREEEAMAKAAKVRVVGAQVKVTAAMEAREMAIVVTVESLAAMAEAAVSRTLPPTPPTLGCLQQSSLQKSLPSDMHRSTDTTWQTLARLKQYQIQSSPQSRRHSPRWCWSSP